MKAKKGILRLLEIAQAKKYLLFLACFFASLHAILSLAPYILSYEILNQSVSNNFQYKLLQTYVIYSIIAIICAYVCLYIALILSHMAAFEILYKFRVQIAKKLATLSIGYLQNRATGELKKVLVDDIEKIEKFLAHNLIDIIKASLMPILILIYMFILDYRLAFASLAPLIVFFLWLFIIFKTKALQEITKVYSKSIQRMDSVVVEYVRSIALMKIFNQDANRFKNFKNSIDEYTQWVLEYIDKNSNFYSFIISFISNSILPILAFGVYFYFQKEINFITLLFFLILGVAYLKPVLAISTLANSIFITYEAVNEIDNILEEEEKLKDTEKKEDFRNYNIEYENVSFAYGEKKVLENINLKLNQGEITAFVGLSGAGKSTCAELLARFYELKEGSIKIGNTDIKEVSYSFLMNKISFVFQDNFMFSDTIFENIAMGKEVSLEEVIKVAKLAQAHGFISKLKDGYETIYSKNIALSGGQIQRIQLARVFLKNSPIIILDEATSFFDAKNEYKIQKALTELVKNKTVLLIAHKLSSIQNVHRIVVFNESKVESIGTHEDLIKNSNIYKLMWESYIKTKDFGLKGEY